MKPRICHLTSVHPRHDVRIFVKECQSLAAGGYEVCLLTADGLGEENRGGVRIIGLNRPVGGRFGRATVSVWKIFRLAKTLRADVYHFHDPELIPAGLLLKMSGKKVVYDVHEDAPRQVLTKDYLPPALRPVIARLFERFEETAARRFDAVVTVTDHLNSRFSRLNRNTVSVKNYPIVQELSNSVPWRNKRHQVCYIGGLGRARGLFELLEAIDGLEAGLALAGDFESLKMQNEARNRPGWAKVDFHGYVDRNKVAAILADSRAGLVTLHPTERYKLALPIKMFEYMAAGIPVISSDFPLWRSIVEGHKCGLCVDPRSPGEISRAVQWILDNPAEAEAMGRRGREAVAQNYNWDSQSRKLLDLYQKLLSGDQQADSGCDHKPVQG